MGSMSPMSRELGRFSAMRRTPKTSADSLAVEPVWSQLVSATNSLYQGNLQGKSCILHPHSWALSIESLIPSGFPRLQ